MFAHLTRARLGAWLLFRQAPPSRWHLLQCQRCGSCHEFADGAAAAAFAATHPDCDCPA